MAHKFYLASAYIRRDELREYAKVIEKYGAEVTSRWLHGTHGMAPVTDTSPEADFQRARFAYEDLEDIRAADTLLSFTGEGGRGGRQVEFGFAISEHKILVLVGPREHVFHYLPTVIQFDTFQEFEDEVLGPANDLRRLYE